MPLRPTLLRLKAAAVLTIAGAAALIQPAAAHAQQIYINTPVQMYAGPDLDYPIVATLHPGLAVELAGCLPNYDWCDVILYDGLRGWVFGRSLSYPWRGEVLPVPQYGSVIGIPLISFSIGDYWGNHYRNQPWYDDHRWRRPPPPQPRVMPAPPPQWGGWQQPYPQRDGRERAFPPDQGRPFTPDRDRPFPPRQERIAPPQGQSPQQPYPPPPRQEREPNRGGGGGVNVAPAPAPAPSVGGAPPFQPRPEKDRPFFPHRTERMDAPRQQEAVQPRPAMAPPPGPAPAGGAMPMPPQRMEMPRPQREIALPPRHDRGESGNRPDAPRGNP